MFFIYLLKLQIQEDDLSKSNIGVTPNPKTLGKNFILTK